MSYYHILVATDLSEQSKKLVDKAVEQAIPGLTDVSIVYVDVSHIIEGKKDQLRYKEQLQKLAQQCDFPIVDTSVVVGDLQMKIAGLVENQDIDLVVCGHKHRVLSQLLSSAPKLINNVNTDLLVVHLE